MVWLVNMADTDIPRRNSKEAASPQQEAQEGEISSDGWLSRSALGVESDCYHLFAATSAASPSSPSQDDGGFTTSWVNHQQHQLGNLQSTENTRREIQEMPSARPPAEEDDEESECIHIKYRLSQFWSCFVNQQRYFVFVRSLQSRKDFWRVWDCSGSHLWMSPTLQAVSFCFLRGCETGPGRLHLLQYAGGKGLSHSQRRLEHHSCMLCSHPHCEWPQLLILVWYSKHISVSAHYLTSLSMKHSIV